MKLKIHFTRNMVAEVRRMVSLDRSVQGRMTGRMKWIDKTFPIGRSFSLDIAPLSELRLKQLHTVLADAASFAFTTQTQDAFGKRKSIVWRWLNDPPPLVLLARNAR